MAVLHQMAHPHQLQGRAMGHIEPACSLRFRGPVQPLLPTARLCNGHRDVPQGAGARSSLCTRGARQEGEQERAHQEQAAGAEVCSPLCACPELKAFRAVIPRALPSLSGLLCHQCFHQLWEEGEQDPGANPRGSPCLGQKGSSRMLESIVHGIVRTGELLMFMEGFAGTEQRWH